MHQCRCLKSLSWFFFDELCRSELPQFVIHQRQQLLRSLRIAMLNLRQDAGYVGHDYEDSQPAAEKPESARDRARDMPGPAGSRVSEKVSLMLRLLRDFASRRPIELDSHQRYGFSARKSCFKN